MTLKRWDQVPYKKPFIFKRNNLETYYMIRQYAMSFAVLYTSIASCVILKKYIPSKHYEPKKKDELPPLFF